MAAQMACLTVRHVVVGLCVQVQGDHLLLLTLYQLWGAAGFGKDFVHSYGLDLRGMNFAREVRKQLAGARGPEQKACPGGVPDVKFVLMCSCAG
jgi:hypothetical protein